MSVVLYTVLRNIWKQILEKECYNRMLETRLPRHAVAATLIMIYVDPAIWLAVAAAALVLSAATSRPSRRRIAVLRIAMVESRTHLGRHQRVIGSVKQFSDCKRVLDVLFSALKEFLTTRPFSVHALKVLLARIPAPGELGTRKAALRPVNGGGALDAIFEFPAFLVQRILGLSGAVFVVDRFKHQTMTSIIPVLLFIEPVLFAFEPVFGPEFFEHVSQVVVSPVVSLILSPGDVAHFERRPFEGFAGHVGAIIATLIVLNVRCVLGKRKPHQNH